MEPFDYCYCYYYCFITSLPAWGKLQHQLRTLKRSLKYTDGEILFSFPSFLFAESVSVINATAGGVAADANTAATAISVHSHYYITWVSAASGILPPQFLTMLTADLHNTSCTALQPPSCRAVAHNTPEKNIAAAVSPTY